LNKTIKIKNGRSEEVFCRMRLKKDKIIFIMGHRCRPMAVSYIVFFLSTLTCYNYSAFQNITKIFEENLVIFGPKIIFFKNLLFKYYILELVYRWLKKKIINFRRIIPFMIIFTQKKCRFFVKLVISTEDWRQSSI
jgi:type III secretory pathway component EscS